jgi:hypothetical protein
MKRKPDWVDYISARRELTPKQTCLYRKFWNSFPDTGNNFEVNGEVDVFTTKLLKAKGVVDYDVNELPQPGAYPHIGGISLTRLGQGHRSAIKEELLHLLTIGGREPCPSTLKHFAECLPE